jgi:hypothetical protein
LGRLASTPSLNHQVCHNAHSLQPSARTGNHGLGVHQAGAAKVVNATVEDLRTAHEPDRLSGVETTYLFKASGASAPTAPSMAQRPCTTSV